MWKLERDVVRSGSGQRALSVERGGNHAIDLYVDPGTALRSGGISRYYLNNTANHDLRLQYNTFTLYCECQDIHIPFFSSIPNMNE